MAKQANFAVELRVLVVTPRNRLQVLLLVFAATYLLCCRDIELNSGSFGKETDEHTTQDSQEETSTTKGDKTRVDSQTVSKPTDKIFVQPTDIGHDMGLRILADKCI